MDQLLDFLNQKKVLFVLIFFILLSCLFGMLYVSEVTAEESFSCPKLETIEEEEQAKEEGMYVVDIKGAIQTPGFIELQKIKL